MESLTEKLSKSTRRLRYAQLKAFCNFLIEKCNLNMRNPCNAPLLAKAFKTPKQVARRGPKSGKESEVAFMPEQIARRVNDYIQQKGLSPEDPIFPICYSTARALIKKLGKKLNVDLTPHDLRRYSATHASRNGVPLEIISKVLLRHQDLKTTQVYLGKVTESEAIRWMDFLNGK